MYRCTDGQGFIEYMFNYAIIQQSFTKKQLPILNIVLEKKIHTDRRTERVTNVALLSGVKKINVYQISAKKLPFTLSLADKRTDRRTSGIS